MIDMVLSNHGGKLALGSLDTPLKVNKISLSALGDNGGKVYLIFPTKTGIVMLNPVEDLRDDVLYNLMRNKDHYTADS